MGTDLYFSFLLSLPLTHTQTQTQTHTHTHTEVSMDPLLKQPGGGEIVLN